MKRKYRVSMFQHISWVKEVEIEISSILLKRKK